MTVYKITVRCNLHKLYETENFDEKYFADLTVNLKRIDKEFSAESSEESRLVHACGINAI